MKYISSYIVTAFSILSKQIKRAIVGIQAGTRTLQQPRMQYRMALLLATVIVFLMGWPLFLSTPPHVPLTLLRHL